MVQSFHHVLGSCCLEMEYLLCEIKKKIEEKKKESSERVNLNYVKIKNKIFIAFVTKSLKK